jgi:hypothetical protein
VFLVTYDTSGTVRRQTKGCSMTIRNPLLDITAAAHPIDILGSMKSDGDADDLLSRFLFAASAPQISYSHVRVTIYQVTHNLIK